MKQIMRAALASVVLAVAATHAGAQSNTNGVTNTNAVSNTNTVSNTNNIANTNAVTNTNTVSNTNEVTNTNTTTGGGFWVQNANFRLISQSSSGRATLTSKTLVQDLSGAVATTAGGVVTSTPSVTLTNPAFLALGPGQDYFTNGASITNSETITFTNGQMTNITIVSTRTETNPPTFTFTNVDFTSTNNETVGTFTNDSTLPPGALTAVLVGTNPAVFTISGGTVVTTNVSETVTNPTFGRNAKLIVKSPSPSGAAGELGQFFVREGSSRNPRDTDVSAFFPNSMNLIIAASKGNGTVEDFNLGFIGRTKNFDTRGEGSSNMGSKGGVSQRRTLNSTLVGSGTNNSSPIVISGKFTISGGAVEQ